MDRARPNSAPLTGIRVLEFAGLGPAPYGGMLLADLGADVLRIERPGAADLFAVPNPPVDRGKRSLVLDLKEASATDLCLRIVGKADVLIEGFRPGVMERLGLGPDVALARNSRLIYARMTGWGQDGPLAQTAGHDLTFLALTGALHAIGPAAGLCELQGGRAAPGNAKYVNRAAVAELEAGEKVAYGRHRSRLSRACLLRPKSRRKGEARLGPRSCENVYG